MYTIQALGSMKDDDSTLKGTAHVVQPIRRIQILLLELFLFTCQMGKHTGQVIVLIC